MQDTAEQIVPAAFADEALRLDNQLCFPLYVAAKEVVRRYTPLLEEFDLTYTQYICLMALWETDGLSVHELGERLYLDSGTLTPLLKRMEARGLLVRERCAEDERRLVIRLADKGRALKEEVARVPLQMACDLPLSNEEGAELTALLRALLSRLSDGEGEKA